MDAPLARASLVARLVLTLAAFVVLATARLPEPAFTALRQAPADPAPPATDWTPLLVRLGVALALGAALGVELSRRRAWR